MSDYPHEVDLKKLKKMCEEVPKDLDWMPTVRFAQSIYNHSVGRMTLKGGYLSVATGGWSGNEDIIGTMMSGKSMFRMTCWEKSERGGYFLFRIKNKHETKHKTTTGKKATIKK